MPREVKPSSSSTTGVYHEKALKKSTLKRLFSSSKKGPVQEEIEPTVNWESDRLDFHSSRELVLAPSRSILKLKTQKESLSKLYPKPFLCPQCCCPEHKKKKSVRFSTVTIQSYPTILSDHPCVMKGAPVGLDWEVVHVETITVAQHFTSNPWRGQSRPQSFHLSEWRRERLLLARGYSKAQLKRAEREALRIRASRRKNAQSFPSWMYPVIHLFYETNLGEEESARLRTKRKVSDKKGKKAPQKPKVDSSRTTLSTQEEVKMWLNMSCVNAN